MSNSGKSIELLDLLYFASKKKVMTLLITSNKESKLSRMATHNIFLPKLKEVGKNNIAPTTSTTMMLALGDAIALSVSELKKFPENKFGEFHPGGNIGKKFLTVTDIMHEKKQIPLTKESTSMKEVIIKISNKNFGCIGILDKFGNLCGIITDGELRRHMQKDILDKKAKDVMSKNPKTILKNTFVSDALKIINNYKITSLFVVKSFKEKKPLV